MLAHNVVFRRPTIVTLAPQPLLTKSVVRYLIDLKGSHMFKTSARSINGLRVKEGHTYSVPLPLMAPELRFHDASMLPEVLVQNPTLRSALGSQACARAKKAFGKPESG